jgi:phosphatidylserine/phosphatidylglycerophosphate/cardiolipin synthase-like enzyme
VQLLLADWSKRKGTIEGLQSLQVVPGIDVRLNTVPQWSGGFVPFARVGHAKYMIVDGRRVWIGTGNWEGDYFFNSRNAGLIVESAAVGSRLDRYFADAWGSAYAYDVDACATYEPPRVAHAKYMVVDGRRAWIGTGNWEGDYFTQSRNAGLVIDSPKIGERLDRFFADAWGSPYAYDVDACATYEPPRVAE